MYIVPYHKESTSHLNPLNLLTSSPPAFTLYTLPPTLKKSQKNAISLAHITKIHYLCTAFSVREAGEIPAQSRCCDSQSDVQILISHWFLANWEG